MTRWTALNFWMIDVILSSGISAAESPSSDLESLRQELTELRKTKVQLTSRTSISTDASVLRAIERSCDPIAPPSDPHSKLNISSIIQVWFYAAQKDNKALFQNNLINRIDDTNEAVDNSGFRIRRTDIKFTYSINDSISAVVLIDPSREAQSFPTIPDNQANQSIYKRGLNANLTNLRDCAGSAARILQDAYISYRAIVPRHDLTIGQFKTYFGEEAQRPAGELDFVERSMLGQLGDFRDLGAGIHGSWWNAIDDGDGRFQYWIGAFDCAGNFQQSGGQYQNQADDNNEKDFCFRALIRPFWKKGSLGDLELGSSFEFGEHGASGGLDPIAAPLNGVNRRRTLALRRDGWMYYAPSGSISGLWLRAEWEWQRDSNYPLQVVALTGTGDSFQTNGRAYTTQGFYAAAGFKLSEARFCARNPNWYKKLEFAFRFEQYQNVNVENLQHSARTDVYRTNVYTAGINYYLSGNNKLQLNYNVIQNPQAPAAAGYKFHNPRNDMFAINFQLAF
jgi:phosphate-selective porin